MLTIQPFDPTAIKQIEKTILESDLGLTPSNDGKLIRLPIPQLTEERRKELVKLVKQMAEEGRVAVRNVRRDAMKHLEELVKNGDVGDDEERAAESRVQKLTDEHVHEDRRAAEAQRSRDHGGLRTSMRLLSRIRTLARVRPLPERDLPEVAESVAIIMDGNGRWAKRRGLPTAVGHRAGARTVRRIVEAAIDLGRPRPVRLRVLDGELVAPAGRGRRADGDLRRDDRARAARPRRAGRARALHRPPRPRAGDAAPADGGDGGPHRAEHAHQPLGRIRLRRPRRARRGDAADRRERRRRATRSTRTSSRRTCTRPSCPIRIC